MPLRRERAAVNVPAAERRQFRGAQGEKVGADGVGHADQARLRCRGDRVERRAEDRAVEAEEAAGGPQEKRARPQRVAATEQGIGRRHLVCDRLEPSKEQETAAAEVARAADGRGEGGEAAGNRRWRRGGDAGRQRRGGGGAGGAGGGARTGRRRAGPRRRGGGRGGARGRGGGRGGAPGRRGDFHGIGAGPTRVDAARVRGGHDVVVGRAV